MLLFKNIYFYIKAELAAVTVQTLLDTHMK